MESFNIIICSDLMPYYKDIIDGYLSSSSVFMFEYEKFQKKENRDGLLKELPPEGYLLCSDKCDLWSELKDPGKYPPLVTFKSPCDLLISPGMVKKYESWGAFFLTQKSLLRKKDTIPSDAKLLVYISIDGEEPDELKELANETGLPCQSLPADTEYIELIMNRYQADYEIKKRDRLQKKELLSFQKSSANYGAMLSIIERLTRAKDEKAVFDLLKEVIREIFGAKKIAWYEKKESINEGADSTSIMGKKQRYVLDGEKGFFVRIENANNVLGFLEIGDFKCPEHIKSYLEFILNISDVIGISIASARMFEKLKEDEDRFRHYSLHDSLTGLGNRFYFNKKMQEAREDKRGTTFGVMVCDLDGLKAINDNYGHQAGDYAIEETARILRKSLREEDFPARVGGDEFAAVIKNCDEKAIEHIRERLIKNLTESNESSKQPFKLDFSVGFSIADGVPPRMEDAFRQADDRMYAAKREKKRQKLAEV